MDLVLPFLWVILQFLFGLRFYFLIIFELNSQMIVKGLQQRMYKLLITSKKVQCHWCSPFRKVVFLTEENTITEQHQQPQFSISAEKKHLVVGNIHLYRSKKQENKLNENSTTQKMQNHQIQIKTQVLLLINLTSQQFADINHLCQQRLQNIQLIQIVKHQQSKNTSVDIAIYFKSLLISEQFFTLVNSAFHYFIIYIKEVVIVQATNPHELTKLQLINGFEHQQKNQQTIHFLQEYRNKSIVYKQNWVQLPSCNICLGKLEFDITGFSPEYVQTSITSKNVQTCKTCTILESKINQNIVTHCQDCETSEDNWICMICNRVGCGRYKNADAFNHFLKSGHIITMDLQTQRVWNYLSDCFSHRVIPLQKQQITLKFPDYSHQRSQSKNQDSLQGAFWQYCSVVSQQLQRQRSFYQKMRLQEDQRFNRQNKKIESNIFDITKLIQEKSQFVKKLSKKNKKIGKRLAEVKEKCLQDRQMLANYQKRAKEQKELSITQIQKQSPKIQQKIKILNDLDEQVSSILMKLTE